MKQLASLVLLAVLAASTVTLPAGPATAANETRSLKLYFVHTGERAVITFKRNGRYDSSGLQQLNQFLRDWRRNEPTRMDPPLFDLVWEVYRRSGATDYIHVVSAIAFSDDERYAAFAHPAAWQSIASTCWARRWTSSFLA